MQTASVDTKMKQWLDSLIGHIKNATRTRTHTFVYIYSLGISLGYMPKVPMSYDVIATIATRARSLKK